MPTDSTSHRRGWVIQTTLYACANGHVCNITHIPNEAGVRKCMLCGKPTEPYDAAVHDA